MKTENKILTSKNTIFVSVCCFCSIIGKAYLNFRYELDYAIDVKSL